VSCLVGRHPLEAEPCQPSRGPSVRSDGVMPSTDTRSQPENSVRCDVVETTLKGFRAEVEAEALTEDDGGEHLLPAASGGW
jgi:hypothetical protein